MKKGRTPAVILLVTIACLLLAQFNSEAGGPPPGRIKNPNVILASGLAGPFVPYPVAVEKGFFAKYGLNAQVRGFASGVEAIQAVGARAVQASSGGELAVVVPRSKGADLVVVARNIVNGVGGVGGIESISWGDIGLGTGRGINGPKDLVGKKCGVLLGSTGEWYAFRYMSVYGLNPRDVTLVNMAAPEWLPGMVRGDIQCFFGWEPWLTELPRVVSGAQVIHRGGKDGVYVLQNVTVFNESWVKEDPEAAKAVMNALIDTWRWVNVNRQEAARIAAKAFQADPATLARQMDCCVYKVEMTQQLVDGVTEVAKWGLSRGMFTMNVDQLISSLFFPSVIKSVAPDKCTANMCKNAPRI